MCTPVYVTVKTASLGAAAANYIIGVVLLAIGAAISFFTAFKLWRKK